MSTLLVVPTTISVTGASLGDIDRLYFIDTYFDLESLLLITRGIVI